LTTIDLIIADCFLKHKRRWNILSPNEKIEWGKDIPSS